MITLEVADLVVIASRTLGLDTGQVVGLLDTAAAGHALAQAQLGSDPADPAAPAGALLQGLVRGRPLRRGNQQVALAAMLQFLALNGWELDPGPPRRSQPWSPILRPGCLTPQPWPPGCRRGCGPAAVMRPA